MADDIGTVVDDLNALNTATIRSGIEFKGFTKSLTKAAAGTEGASKAWTTFSRLVSGTPLWAAQNKFRAYLSILAGFENRSQANSKAMKEEDKLLVKRVQSIKKVNDQHKFLNASMKGTIKTMAREKKSFEEATKSNLSHSIKAEKISIALLKKEKKISIAKMENRKKEISDGLSLAERNQNKLVNMVKTNDKKELKSMLKKSGAYNKYRKLDKFKRSSFLADRAKAARKEVKSRKNTIASLDKIITKEHTIFDKQIKKEQAALDKKTQNLRENNRAVKEAVKNTKEYNLAILAGASEQMAFAEGSRKINARFKDLKKNEEALTRSAKEAYAFDNKRVATRKKMAKLKAKGKGKGKLGQMLAGRKGAGKEKKLMRGQQKKVVGASYKDNLKGSMGAVSDFKPLLAPLAPLKGMFSLAKNRKKYQMKINKFTAKAKPILNMAFKYFLFGLMAIVAFMTLIPFLYGAWKTFQSLPIMDDIKDFGGRLIDFGKQIFDVINTFATSGLDEGVKKLGPLFNTGLGLLIDGLKGLAKITWMLLNFAWTTVLDFFDKLWNDTAFREMIFEKLFTIGKIILAAWFVKTLIANAIQLAGMLAIPLMIGVVLVSGLILFWERYGLPWLKKLPENLGKMAGWLLDKYLGWAEGVGTIIESTLVTLWKYVKGVLADIKDALTDDPDKGWWDENKSIIGLHKGGMAHGNMNLVGEKGPELVKLPAGSRVYSNSQSKSMSGGSTVINTNITINAKDTSDAELRRIADKIGGMVNNKINRTTSSRTFG